MPMNVTQKIIEMHLLKGKMIRDTEIALKIDQVLCEDAMGTLVMLELEAINLDRTKVNPSVQYIDHNLIQDDFRNPDDHLFLESAAKRFGLHFSPAGNGVSHPVHQQYFGIPGKTLVGCDSHTCAAGSLGMLAIGVGGLEAAMAMAGHSLYINMPGVFGIKLTGQLPDWVSAKDIILEMLRRYDVKGAVGYVIEYYGPGLKHLTVMDRHVIANMGAELGATTTVFLSDTLTYDYLSSVGREKDYHELVADEGATYDRTDQINLSELVPLIAKPTSPGNVVPVSDVAGQKIYQAYVGSSANPGYRDYAIVAEIVKGKTIKNNISFDINPSSRSILEEITRDGYLAHLIHAGARIHQAGCNGCIGMGQAPASGCNSVRTVPRNFSGRSGTPDDKVFLCSPETAAASAIMGVITDPRDLKMPYPKVTLPKKRIMNSFVIENPLPPVQARKVPLIKGPNITTLLKLEPLPESYELSVLMKVDDNISTDDISPAGNKVLPYYSNISKMSVFTYCNLDATYAKRAFKKIKLGKGHVIIAGENYGQGSSREHAALAPRYLGLRLVIAKSFARIHWQNLINFGIIPFIFIKESDYDLVAQGDIFKIHNLSRALENDNVDIHIGNKNKTLTVSHNLSKRQRSIIMTGGLINWGLHCGHT